MQFNTYDRTAMVRLDKGDDVAACLLRYAELAHVTLASIMGIGAVDDLTVGVFDLATNAYRRMHYTGNHEINALVGNLTTKDGAPYLHLHITCTDLDGRVVGGHLLAATVSLTAEIFVHVTDGVVDRAYDPDLGINRIVWPE